MSLRTSQDPQQRQQLSALMDGEADPTLALRLCAAWRNDADARATWHTWHLIGDVLRSEDLASPASRDERFVALLRERLGAEPVVLAPQAPRRAAGSRAWATAGAVAAGLAMVVGAAVVTNFDAPTDAPAQIAAQSAPPPPPVQSVVTIPPEVAVPMAEPQVLIADGKLIRDARIDRYLAAHKPFGGSPALAMQSSFMRARAGNAESGR